MSQKQSSRALDPFLRDAGRALFDALSLPAHSVDEVFSSPDEGEKLMGVIGFANEQMSGALCVTATREVVRALQPAELRDTDASDAVLLDVVTEFANMLLGRMKTQLARRGVAVLLSTPTASIAQKMQIWSPPTLGAVWYAFVTSAGSVFARVALSIEPGVVLDGVCPPAEEPLAEGEMMML